jgi:hypothetical protein
VPARRCWVTEGEPGGFTIDHRSSRSRHQGGDERLVVAGQFADASAYREGVVDQGGGAGGLGREVIDLAQLLPGVPAPSHRPPDLGRLVLGHSRCAVRR